MGAAIGASALISLAQAGAVVAPEAHTAPGPEPVADVILPFDMQRLFSRSLPIAGLMVTPDQVAQLVLMNPRLRVTADLPSSGKGMVTSIDQSNVADTHADPSD